MTRRSKRASRSRREVYSPRLITRTGMGGESAANRLGDPSRMRSSSLASGGIRRIALADALRFAQNSGGAFQPATLRVQHEPTRVVEHRSDDEITEALYGHLRAGRAEKASGLIQLLFLAGRSVAQIIDGAFQLALLRVGEDWNGYDAGPSSWEQRAVQICIRILHELSAGSPKFETPLVAVGATPSRDPFILPTMSAAAVLESVGFDATNLGPQTATATLVATVHELQPALVWLSITAQLDDRELQAEVETVLEAVNRVGGTLVLGGREAHRFQAPEHHRLLLCDSMVELAAFATGLSHRNRSGA